MEQLEGTRKESPFGILKRESFHSSRSHTDTSIEDLTSVFFFTKLMKVINQSLTAGVIRSHLSLKNIAR